jgi:hypothetical protein
VLSDYGVVIPEGNHIFFFIIILSALALSPLPPVIPHNTLNCQGEIK